MPHIGLQAEEEAFEKYYKFETESLKATTHEAACFCNTASTMKQS